MKWLIAKDEASKSLTDLIKMQEYVDSDKFLEDLIEDPEEMNMQMSVFFDEHKGVWQKYLKGFSNILQHFEDDKRKVYFNYQKNLRHAIKLMLIYWDIENEQTPPEEIAKAFGK